MSNINRIKHELKALIQLAVPILIAQLSFTAMGFIDTVMAGHYSEIDLAAIAIGTSLTIPLVLFGQAILFSVTAKAAPYWGAGDYLKAGHCFKEGIVLAIYSAAPLLCLLLLLAHNLENFGLSKELSSIAARYQFFIALSLPITGLYQASRSYIESTGQTRPMMVINLLGLLFNIPLNYVFIYGYAGFPPMGSAGCGLATLLVFAFMLIASWLFIKHNKTCQCGFDAVNPKPITFKEVARLSMGAFNLAKLGFPIALTMLAEVSLFTVIALLIAPLGTLMIASHQIALNVSSQLFMLPYSQATAMTIRVGHLMGEKNKHHTLFAIKVGLGLGVCISILTASFVGLGSQLLAQIYTDNSDIILIASGLLTLAAIYQIPDAIQVISNGILRAFHCVKSPLVVSLCSYWLIALPTGYYLAFYHVKNEPLGAAGFWQALILGLSLNAIGLAYLLHKQIKILFENNT